MATAGGEVPVEAPIFAPEDEGDIWRCRYEIGWPEGEPRRGYGAGVDAVQALTHALMLLGVALHTSPYHRDGTLVWEKPGSGYGFIVPKNVRDVLRGDDAVFWG